jgi:hypothetical protein
MTELAFANGFRLPEESGNRGGWFSAKVQELARQHAASAIAELARLAVKARSETARIAAIRELLDRRGR